jgi:hypothetical protein
LLDTLSLSSAHVDRCDQSAAGFSRWHLWRRDVFVFFTCAVLTIALIAQIITKFPEGINILYSVDAPAKSAHPGFLRLEDILIRRASPNIYVSIFTRRNISETSLREKSRLPIWVSECGRANCLVRPDSDGTLHGLDGLKSSKIRRQFITGKIISRECCNVGRDSIPDILPMRYGLISVEDPIGNRRRVSGRNEKWRDREIPHNERGTLGEGIVLLKLIDLGSEFTGLGPDLPQLPRRNNNISGGYQSQDNGHSGLNMISGAERERYPPTNAPNEPQDHLLLKSSVGIFLLLCAVSIITFAVLSLNGSMAAIDDKDFQSARILAFLAAILWVIGGVIMWKGLTLTFPSFSAHSEDASVSLGPCSVSATTYSRYEDVWVVPIVVPKFKFRNIQGQIFTADLVGQLRLANASASESGFGRRSSDGVPARRPPPRRTSRLFLGPSAQYPERQDATARVK